MTASGAVLPRPVGPLFAEIGKARARASEASVVILRTKVFPSRRHDASHVGPRITLERTAKFQVEVQIPRGRRFGKGIVNVRIQPRRVEKEGNRKGNPRAKPEEVKMELKASQQTRMLKLKLQWMVKP